jgi:endonuclease I
MKININIIKSPSMPSVYSNCNPNSIEHIFPKSFLINYQQKYDMHNLFKCNIRINQCRSNYKFVNEFTKNKEWIKIDYDNYVNNKEKLFIPNDYSKGIISRAILYMCYKYNINHSKTIDYKNLLLWNTKYPPLDDEIYHNKIVKQIQKSNNVFISNYEYMLKLYFNNFT